MSRRILVVDDDRSTCDLLADGLRRRGFDTRCFTSADEAFAALGGEEFDAVLTDLNMPGIDGLGLCERVAANRPDIPVVVITGFGSLETAVAAIRAGAYDFVIKPVEMASLAVALERAVQHRALREEVRRLRQAVAEIQHYEDLLGASPAMKQLFDLLERIGDSEASVLITGESGTGKELVARALHARSRRRDGPFVALNCAAVPEALLESELFGHVRGAFTDARVARSGLFLQAQRGTLVLDEVGELPLSLQPKLLRALQERSARPVGGDTESPFDVRFIATTNRDLESAVEERRFREDLFFRINVIHVPVPPLRSRGGDVLLLTHHFLQRYAAASGKRVSAISGATAERLASYSWPGNVRELQNCIERAVALTRYEEITVEDLPERIRNYRRSHILVAGDDLSEMVPMEEVERRYILRVLEAASGNKTLAAQVLGLDRRTLYRKLERYGVPGIDG